jgi:hypothetical protein
VDQAADTVAEEVARIEVVDPQVATTIDVAGEVGSGDPTTVAQEGAEATRATSQTSARETPKATGDDCPPTL